MKIYKKVDITSINDCVACIGYFDGVHLGHQALIKKTIEIANRKGITPLVISFYPDPETVLFNKEVKSITSLDERLNLFERYGINKCLLLEFDYELMNLSPEEFIKSYILNANVKTLICGFDFRFGKNATGDISLLKEYVDTIEIEEIKYKDKKISSTYIRELIKDNNFDLAYKLMGHE